MTDSFEIARTYAWCWFEYHASQRMTVFRFFLIFAAIISAGYVQVVVKAPLIGTALGLFLSFITVALWRLDQRNVVLIKLAETHLKDHEERLALDVGPGIKLIGQTDGSRTLLSSFSSIFRLVFSVIFLMGILAAVCPIFIVYV